MCIGLLGVKQAHERWKALLPVFPRQNLLEIKLVIRWHLGQFLDWLERFDTSDTAVETFQWFLYVATDIAFGQRIRMTPVSGCIYNHRKVQFGSMISHQTCASAGALHQKFNSFCVCSADSQSISLYSLGLRIKFCSLFQLACRKGIHMSEVISAFVLAQWVSCLQKIGFDSVNMLLPAAAYRIYA